MKYWRHSLMAVALLCSLALAACGKLTADNYKKLQIGMSSDDVEQIIGTPTSCDDVMKVKVCKWGKGGSSITIGFVAEKVIWMNAVNLR